jgi:hypothetical protein
MSDKNSLTHYASKYYDPVKAHEYYLRTRQLKGKRSTSALNEEGKKIWSSTKNEIAIEKKAAVEAAKNDRDSNIEELRNRATATRESISKKLRLLEERLFEEAKKKQEAIDRNRISELDKLLETTIPEGLSEEERARRIEARDKKIAKLYSDSKRDKARVSQKARSKNVQSKTDLSAERSKVATELKSAISAARDAYTKTKASLNESYETTYQQEYDKILAEYGK